VTTRQVVSLSPCGHGVWVRISDWSPKNTYIPRFIPEEVSDISDIPPRHYIDVPGGKPIAV
jgi:hypothetical protein